MTPQRLTRPVIESVRPLIDCGRFPLKRIDGESLRVEADIFVDGHDRLSAVIRHRRPGEEAWAETPLRLLGNDHWEASFQLDGLGTHIYVLTAWVDSFGTWVQDLGARRTAGVQTPADLAIGAELVRTAAERARRARRRRAPVQGRAESEHDSRGPDATRSLRDWARRLEAPMDEALTAAFDPELQALMRAHADRSSAFVTPEFLAIVERPRAANGGWYELFPRSWASERGRHGTLDDVRRSLPYVSSLGFDVLYLTPIHPIGHTARKGPDNMFGVAGAPGSPWAIGSESGGHTAVEPALGTLDDFDRLVAASTSHGLEVAIDLAFQCSPDHPWVREHPQWFRHRPDGSIAYAENPPKKYEDIYPLDFETPDWEALWHELAEVVRFWTSHGVRIFRVDNPHTKPFDFWEWLIAEVRREHPDVVFLSEAFTRPRLMQRLSKLGFDQSYAYFPWRITKQELTDYMIELTTTELKEYFRPSFWTNTPDILIEYLQTGGRAAFAVRLVLAATLAANYGVYGPAFELLEAEPREPGSEEYRASEKYEIRSWDLDSAESLAPLVTLVNGCRRAHPALRSNEGLRFHDIDNEQLIAYSKSTPDQSDVVLVFVNLDPRWTHAGWTDLDLTALGVAEDRTFTVVDELDGGRYEWRGRRNFVRLDPAHRVAHLFRIEGGGAGARGATPSDRETTA